MSRLRASVGLDAVPEAVAGTDSEDACVSSASGTIQVLRIEQRGSIASERGITVAIDGAVFGLEPKDSARIVLERFLEHGREALPSLDGEFAMVIWDEPAKELHLARDTFGTRPLYFWASENRAAAASRIRDLIDIARISPRLRSESLLSWFPPSQGSFCTTEIHLSDIHRVGPNHVEVVGLPGPRRTRRRLWLYPAQVSGKRTAEDVREELPMLLGAAMARRQTPDALLSLSGGLDSPILAALGTDGSRRSGRQNGLHAVTVVDSAAGHPDGPRARVVAEHFGLPWTSLDAAGIDPVEAFRSLARKCEFPSDLPGIAFESVCVLARAGGHSRVVTGEGADSFWDFDGRRRAWRRLAGRIKTAGRLSARRGEHCLKRVAGFSLPDRGRPAASAARPANCGDECEGQRKLFEGTAWHGRLGAFEKAYGGALFENQVSVADEYGVSFTHPYLDREVAGYALTTPLRVLESGGDRKGLFRSVFPSLLPRGLSETWSVTPWGGRHAASLLRVAESMGIEVPSFDPWSVVLSPEEGKVVDELERLCSGLIWLSSWKAFEEVRNATG